MEQNGKHRNRITQICPINFWQTHKSNEGGIDFLINSARGTGIGKNMNLNQNLISSKKLNQCET